MSSNNNRTNNTARQNNKSIMTHYNLSKETVGSITKVMSSIHGNIEQWDKLRQSKGLIGFSSDQKTTIKEYKESFRSDLLRFFGVKKDTLLLKKDNLANDFLDRNLERLILAADKANKDIAAKENKLGVAEYSNDFVAWALEDKNQTTKDENVFFDIKQQDFLNDKHRSMLAAQLLLDAAKSLGWSSDLKDANKKQTIYDELKIFKVEKAIDSLSFEYGLAFHKKMQEKPPYKSDYLAAMKDCFLDKDFLDKKTKIELIMQNTLEARMEYFQTVINELQAKVNITNEDSELLEALKQGQKELQDAQTNFDNKLNVLEKKEAELRTNLNQLNSGFKKNFSTFKAGISQNLDEFKKEIEKKLKENGNSKELQELKNQIEDIEQKQKDLDEQKQEFEDFKKEVNDNINNITDLVDKHEETLKKHGEQLDKNAKDIMLINEELEQNKKEKAELAKQIQELKEKTNENNKKIEDIKNNEKVKEEELKKQQQEILKKIAGLENDKITKEELDNIKQALKSQEEITIGLLEKYATVDNIKDLTTEIANLKTAQAEFKNIQEKNQSEIEVLNVASQQYKTSLEEHKAKLNEHDERLNGLELAKIEWEKNIQEIKQQLEEQKQKSDKAIKETEAKIQELTEADKKLEEDLNTKASSEELEEAKKQTQEQINTLKLDLERHKAEQLKIQEQQTAINEALDKKIDGVQADLGLKINNVNQYLETNFNKLELENKKLEEALKTNNSEAEAIKTNIATIQKDIQKSSFEQQDLVLKLQKELTEKSSEFEKQIAEANNKLKTVDSVSEEEKKKLSEKIKNDELQHKATLEQLESSKEAIKKLSENYKNYEDIKNKNDALQKAYEKISTKQDNTVSQEELNKVVSENQVLKAKVDEFIKANPNQNINTDALQKMMNQVILESSRAQENSLKMQEEMMKRQGDVLLEILNKNNNLQTQNQNNINTETENQLNLAMNGKLTQPSGSNNINNAKNIVVDNYNKLAENFNEIFTNPEDRKIGGDVDKIHNLLAVIQTIYGYHFDLPSAIEILKTKPSYDTFAKFCAGLLKDGVGQNGIKLNDKGLQFYENFIVYEIKNGGQSKVVVDNFNKEISAEKEAQISQASGKLGQATLLTDLYDYKNDLVFTEKDPNAYLQQDFSQEVLKAVKNFDGTNGLFITGPAGSGKTFSLGQTLANLKGSIGNNVAVMNISGSAIQSASGTYHGADAKTIEDIKRWSETEIACGRVPVLCIDEMQTLFGNDNGRKFLDNLKGLVTGEKIVIIGMTTQKEYEKYILPLIAQDEALARRFKAYPFQLMPFKNAKDNLISKITKDYPIDSLAAEDIASRLMSYSELMYKNVRPASYNIALRGFESLVLKVLGSESMLTVKELRDQRYKLSTKNKEIASLKEQIKTEKEMELEYVKSITSIYSGFNDNTLAPNSKIIELSDKCSKLEAEISKFQNSYSDKTNKDKVSQNSQKAGLLQETRKQLTIKIEELIPDSSIESKKALEDKIINCIKLKNSMRKNTESLAMNEVMLENLTNKIQELKKDESIKLTSNKIVDEDLLNAVRFENLNTLRTFNPQPSDKVLLKKSHEFKNFINNNIENDKEIELERDSILKSLGCNLEEDEKKQDPTTEAQTTLDDTQDPTTEAQTNIFNTPKSIDSEMQTQSNDSISKSDNFSKNYPTKGYSNLDVYDQETVRKQLINQAMQSRINPVKTPTNNLNTVNSGQKIKVG